MKERVSEGKSLRFRCMTVLFQTPISRIILSFPAPLQKIERIDLISIRALTLYYYFVVLVVVVLGKQEL